MSQLYDWEKNWEFPERDRRISIVQRLTNIIRVKMQEVERISSLDEIEKYRSRITIRFMKEMFFARPQLSHEDVNVKKFL